ncbi:MAG TPA: tyrosine-protein phosphatase [Candidatus Xenobia bacterium]|jgi:protein tyrosine/serine phosphatase
MIGHHESTSTSTGINRPGFTLPQQRLLDAPIPNFGRVVTGRLYRGAQPTRGDLAWLYQQGVRTVVVLREDQEERRYVQADYLDDLAAHGLQAVVMTIKDGAIPSRAQVEAFIRLVDDPSRSAVYVHCAAGVGRTGVLVGLYLKWHGVPVVDILTTSRTFGLTPERRSDLSLQATFIATYPLALLKVDGPRGASQEVPLSLL